MAIDREMAGHYMADLNWDGAIQDLSACARYLKSKGCRKVAVTGFCLGGALSFAAAAVLPDDISAAAPFYGIPDQSKYDLTKITIPVQAHFGEKDDIVGFSSKSDYGPLLEKLKAANVNVQFCTYDCGHAFANPQSVLGTYNKEMADLAYSRMFDFLHKNCA